MYLFIFIFLFTFTYIQPSYSQAELELPAEFQSLSTNSRALEKSFEITADKDSSQVTQNLVLDKTGFILHLVPSPKIKDDNTKLFVISETGEGVELFNFIDNTLFALVDPEKSYSIIQEIKPNCNSLIENFELDKQNTICPDTEAFKLFENIKLSNDTSFRIRLKTPTEFYSIPILIPESTEQLDNSFNLVEVINPEEFIEIPEGPPEAELNTEQIDLNSQDINISNLLKAGKLCIVSRNKTSKIKQSKDCNFSDNDVKAIITFKEDLKNKNILENNLNIVYSFLSNLFTNSTHELFFELSQRKEPISIATIINKKSKRKLLLEGYDYNLSLNLGKVKKAKNTLNKNIFSLKNPFELTKLLKRISIIIPFEKLEAIINPFTDLNNNSVLTNLTINSNETSNTNNTLKISIENNILVENLIEPTPSPSPTPNTTLSTQITSPSSETEENNLEIISYFPNDILDFTLNKTYTFVEQNIQPSVDDETGESIEIVNNKSKADFIFSKIFDNTDVTNITDSLVFNIKSPSKILEENQGVKDQVTLSGFLVAPDLRPVLEEGYRATFEVSMLINLGGKSSLNISYSDLKTMDEVTITNFFNFSFLPRGLYNSTIRFDANREELFKANGIVKKDNN